MKQNNMVLRGHIKPKFIRIIGSKQRAVKAIYWAITLIYSVYIEVIKLS